jgi:hypothetical protein
MATKRKRIIHGRHPVITKMRRALDKIENDIAEKTADRVVHEIRESKRTERMEHKKHPKGCQCAIHRKRTSRR